MDQYPSEHTGSGSNLRPHLLVMDLSMRTESGIE